MMKGVVDNMGVVICYHITTEDRLGSILKYGLKPNSERNRASRKAPHIMLSLYPCWTLYKNFKKKQKLILIEIRYPQITRDMFDGDPEGLAWEGIIATKYFRAIVQFTVIRM